MSRYILTPRASADIFDIWSYIAADKQDAADRVRKVILDACAFAASSPQSGHLRPDDKSGKLRFRTLTRFTNYTIVYRSGTKPIEIIAILHGKRNFRRVLKERL